MKKSMNSQVLKPPSIQGRQSNASNNKKKPSRNFFPRKSSEQETSSSVPPPASGHINVSPRIRPLLAGEGPEISFTGLTNTSVEISIPEQGGYNKYKFDFERVFGPTVHQEQLFDESRMTELIQNVIGGGISTCLAYGPTGSGKTYTILGGSMRHVSGAAKKRRDSAFSLPDIGAQEMSPGRPKRASTSQSHNSPARTVQRHSPQKRFVAFDIDEKIVPREAGLLPRAIAALFKGRGDLGLTLAVTCLQIYGETVYDLCQVTRPAWSKGREHTSLATVQVRYLGGSDTQVKGAQRELASSVSDVLSIVFRAENSRAIASHALNAKSSRSHALYIFDIVKEPSRASQAQLPRVFSRQPSQARVPNSFVHGVSGGRLVFVDLAGCERLELTGAPSKQRVKEAGSINRSLFLLGKTLVAMAKRSEQRDPRDKAAVSFRDCKLTQLLAPSFGRASRAQFIITASPLRKMSLDTWRALRFGISATAVRIRTSRTTYIAGLLKQQNTAALHKRIRELEAEVEKLQRRHHIGKKDASVGIDFTPREATPLSRQFGSDPLWPSDTDFSDARRLPPTSDFAPPSTGPTEQSFEAQTEFPFSSFFSPDPLSPEVIDLPSPVFRGAGPPGAGTPRSFASDGSGAPSPRAEPARAHDAPAARKGRLTQATLSTLPTNLTENVSILDEISSEAPEDIEREGRA